mmetsp:Transcript_17790/g.49323  ORF Transcript_17790/g.49323 Transcript_17790/m.49323 type:complete len:235 (+) Transcript_17790:71-775(+)
MRGRSRRVFRARVIIGIIFPQAFAFYKCSEVPLRSYALLLHAHPDRSDEATHNKRRPDDGEGILPPPQVSGRGHSANTVGVASTHPQSGFQEGLHIVHRTRRVGCEVLERLRIAHMRSAEIRGDDALHEDPHLLCVVLVEDCLVAFIRQRHCARILAHHAPSVVFGVVRLGCVLRCPIEVARTQRFAFLKIIGHAEDVVRGVPRVALALQRDVRTIEHRQSARLVHCNADRDRV